MNGPGSGVVSPEQTGISETPWPTSTFVVVVGRIVGVPGHWFIMSPRFDFVSSTDP